MRRPGDTGRPGQAHQEGSRGVRRRGWGQRTSLAAAILSYGGAVACLVALCALLGDLGGRHPVIASLGASIVFFVGAGIVLQVVGLADLPSLGFGREDEPPRAR